MSFRGNQNRSRNFPGNNYGGPMGPNRMGNMSTSPWDAQNLPGQFGNMRQGTTQSVNAQALNLANSLINNLFRNRNPPSLLDLPHGNASDLINAMSGNRHHRAGGVVVNRGGVANNNRRGQGQNRGAANGQKSAAKQQGAGGIRKQNAFDRAKKLLAKNANNKKKDNAASNDKKIESKESAYASVPNDMFYCHLCKKHMWDANSFENHIKGRTHLMMREGIEESYRLKANMIRQEAKIAEQLKAIELDRLKRMGKSKQRQLDYCTMCDLNFHGHISIHRKSDGHLQLKKFLHPKCAECNKEFATRIDYDTHLLSADHLKNAAEKNTKVGEHKRQMLPINTEEDELRDVRPPQPRKKTTKKEDESKKEAEEDEPECAEGEEPNEGEEVEGDDIKEEEEPNDSQEEEEAALPEDPEDVILDYVEGEEIPIEVDSRLPKYNWTRPVGVGLIAKLECFECSLCGKCFDTEATVEVHSRTVTHHRNFLRFINEKSCDTKISQKRAAAALEENERKKQKLEPTEVAGESNGTDDSGTGDVTDGPNELYDPSEATADDDEHEAIESGDPDGADEAEEDNDEEMQTQEEAKQQEDVDAKKEAEPEPAPEPVPVPVPVAAKVEAPKAEPVKPPVKVATATTAAPANTPASSVEPSPVKKAAPTRSTGLQAIPGRNRGRARYNRY